MVHAGLSFVYPVQEGGGAARLASANRCVLQEWCLQNRPQPRRPPEQGCWGLNSNRDNGCSRGKVGTMCEQVRFRAGFVMGNRRISLA